MWVRDQADLLLQTYGTLSIVLHINDEYRLARMLASQREPVNIAMEKYFHEDQLAETFGYEESGYTTVAIDVLNSEDPYRLQKTQIAVSCITPLTDGVITKEVAVVSIVGIAFDNPQQVDQMLYRYADGRLNERALLTAMIQSYFFAFNAVLWYMNNGQPRRRILCVSPIGDGAFRPPEYTTDGFRDTFVWPAVRRAYEIFVSSHPDAENIAFDVMDDYPRFNVPESILERPQEELNQYVYINAWDAHSMLGNGNAADRSLDGFWGRSSAISLLGWPMSNPYLQYVGCDAVG